MATTMAVSDTSLPIVLDPWPLGAFGADHRHQITAEAGIYAPTLLFIKHRSSHDELALGSEALHEQMRHFCDRPRKPRPLITANRVLLSSLSGNTQADWGWIEDLRLSLVFAPSLTSRVSLLPRCLLHLPLLMTLMTSLIRICDADKNNFYHSCFPDPDFSPQHRSVRHVGDVLTRQQTILTRTRRCVRRLSLLYVLSSSLNLFTSLP